MNGIMDREVPELGEPHIFASASATAGSASPIQAKPDGLLPQRDSASTAARVEPEAPMHAKPHEILAERAADVTAFTGVARVKRKRNTVSLTVPAIAIPPPPRPPVVPSLASWHEHTNELLWAAMSLGIPVRQPAAFGSGAGPWPTSGPYAATPAVVWGTAGAVQPPLPAGDSPSAPTVSVLLQQQQPHPQFEPPNQQAVDVFRNCDHIAADIAGLTQSTFALPMDHVARLGPALRAAAPGEDPSSLESAMLASDGYVIPDETVLNAMSIEQLRHLALYHRIATVIPNPDLFERLAENGAEGIDLFSDLASVARTRDVDREMPRSTIEQRLIRRRERDAGRPTQEEIDLEAELRTLSSESRLSLAVRANLLVKGLGSMDVLETLIVNGVPKSLLKAPSNMAELAAFKARKGTDESASRAKRSRAAPTRFVAEPSRIMYTKGKAHTQEGVLDELLPGLPECSQLGCSENALLNQSFCAAHIPPVPFVFYDTVAASYVDHWMRVQYALHQQAEAEAAAAAAARKAADRARLAAAEKAKAAEAEAAAKAAKAAAEESARQESVKLGPTAEEVKHTRRALGSKTRIFLHVSYPLAVDDFSSSFPFAFSSTGKLVPHKPRTDAAARDENLPGAAENGMDTSVSGVQGGAIAPPVNAPEEAPSESTVSESQGSVGAVGASSSGAANGFASAPRQAAEEPCDGVEANDAGLPSSALASRSTSSDDHAAEPEIPGSAALQAAVTSNDVVPAEAFDLHPREGDVVVAIDGQPVHMSKSFRFDLQDACNRKRRVAAGLPDAATGLHRQARVRTRNAHASTPASGTADGNVHALDAHTSSSLSSSLPAGQTLATATSRNPHELQLLVQREVQRVTWKSIVGGPVLRPGKPLPAESHLDCPSFVFSIALFRVLTRPGRGGDEQPAPADEREIEEEGDPRFMYYFHSTLDFIRATKERFGDKCSFRLHVNEAVSAYAIRRCQNVAGGPSHFQAFRYKFVGSKKGAVWLTNAMRFRVLWEHEGPEAVVVCDTHDNVDFFHSQLLGLVRKLREFQREIVVTFWESDEDECLSSMPLPLQGHQHVDGGICVFLDGHARAEARKSGNFLRFMQEVLHGAVDIPRGVDEMLTDAFLSRSSVYQRYGMFLEHVHCIRSRAPLAMELGLQDPVTQKQISWGLCNDAAESLAAMKTSGTAQGGIAAASNVDQADARSDACGVSTASPVALPSAPAPTSSSPSLPATFPSSSSSFEATAASAAGAHVAPITQFSPLQLETVVINLSSQSTLNVYVCHEKRESGASRRPPRHAAWKQ